MRLKKLKTGHLIVSAKINGITGTFILDTGSNITCIDFHKINDFNCGDMIAGQAANGMSGEAPTVVSENVLGLGKWSGKMRIVAFDFDYINNILRGAGVPPVDGLIGNDSLYKSKSVIDFGKKTLFQPYL